MEQGTILNTPDFPWWFFPQTHVSLNPLQEPFGEGYAAIISLGVQLANSSYVGLPTFSSLSSQLRDSTGLFLGTCPCTVACKLLQGEKMGNHGAYLHCFLSLRDYGPLLSGTHSLTIHCLVHFCC